MAAALAGQIPEGLEFTPPRVVDLKDYVSKLPAGTTKTFLEKFPRSELRVVQLSGKEAGKPAETAYLFVCLKGGQARIVGIEEPVEKKKR